MFVEIVEENITLGTPVHQVTEKDLGKHEILYLLGIRPSEKTAGLCKTAQGLGKKVIYLDRKPKDRNFHFSKEQEIKDELKESGIEVREVDDLLLSGIESNEFLNNRKKLIIVNTTPESIFTFLKGNGVDIASLEDDAHFAKGNMRERKNSHFGTVIINALDYGLQHPAQSREQYQEDFGEVMEDISAYIHGKHHTRYHLFGKYLRIKNSIQMNLKMNAGELHAGKMVHIYHLQTEDRIPLRINRCFDWNTVANAYLLKEKHIVEYKKFGEGKIGDTLPDLRDILEETKEGLPYKAEVDPEIWPEFLKKFSEKFSSSYSHSL